jgi:hypothetical protein
MIVQLGQGLIESLIVLVTLLLVLCSIHRTGELRHLTLAALYESALIVFSERGHSSFAGYTVGNVETRNSIENELLGRNAGLFTRGVDVQHLTTQAIGNFRKFPSNISSVRRFSYLYSDAGRATSNHSVHHNIGGSKRAWRIVSTHSERLARQAASGTAPIDSVWRRTPPQFDWLSAWNNLIPSSSARVRK